MPAHKHAVQSEQADKSAALLRRKRLHDDDDDDGQIQGDLIAQAEPAILDANHPVEFGDPLTAEAAAVAEEAAANASAVSAAASADTSAGSIASSSSGLLSASAGASASAAAAESGGLGVLGWVGIGAGVVGVGGLAVVLGGEEDSGGGGGGGGGLSNPLANGFTSGPAGPINTSGSVPTAGISNTLAYGVVADGYIFGAEIWIDVDGDGVVSEGDINTGLLTGENGYFQLNAYDDKGDLMPYVVRNEDGTLSLKGSILAVGGVNKDTNVPNDVVYKTPVPDAVEDEGPNAPPKYLVHQPNEDDPVDAEVDAVINPLTTLVQEIVAASGGSKSIAEAEAAVKTALGITTEGSLSAYDPIAANDVAVQKVAASLATAIALAESDTGAGTNKGAAALADLASRIGDAEGQVNLNDVLTKALNTAGAVGVVTKMLEAVETIASAENINAISEVQSATLDKIAPAAPVEINLTPETDSGTKDDDSTNIAAPALRVTLNTTDTTGRAAAVGDTVTAVVKDGGGNTVQTITVTLTAADIAAKHVDLDLEALGEGAYNVSVQLTDKVGNSGTATHYTLTILDPPPVPVIDAVAGDNRVNEDEKEDGITVSGRLQGDGFQSVVVVWGIITKTLSGPQLEVVGAETFWSVTFSPSEIPADGRARVTVTATDAGGNSSSAGRNITIDTVDPVITLGAVAGDNTINLTEKSTIPGNGITLTFTLDAGSTLSPSDISWGDLAPTNLTNTGTVWRATFSGPGLSSLLSADGPLVLTAMARDAAGNTTPFTRTITLDTGAPDTPVIHPVAGDGIVNVAEKTAGVNISGTAHGEVGGKVTVNWGGVQKTATVQADGTWSVHYAHTEVPTAGSSSVTAYITDRAGNPGGTVQIGVTVDIAAPDAPVISFEDTGESDGVTSSRTITVDGVEAGATLEYSLDGGASWVEVTESEGVGTVMFDIPAGDGAKSVTVRQIDAAGNVGAASNAIDFTLDTTAPSAPVIDPVTGDNLVNAAEKAAGVNISGTAMGEAGSKITVNWGGVQKTATVQADGSWSVLYESADIPPTGSSSVSAYIVDRAGHVGSSVQLGVTVDAGGPVALVIDDVTGDDFVNAVEKDAGVTITGRADSSAAGSEVTVEWVGHAQTTYVNADGTWSVTYQANQIPTTEGTTVVKAYLSGAPETMTTRGVNIDTVAPDAPSAALAPESDTGEPDGQYTSVSAPVLRITIPTSGGHAVAVGDYLIVTTGGGSYLDEITIEQSHIAQGFVDVALGTLSPGNHVFRAQLIDQAGNASEWLEGINVTVDTAPPSSSSIAFNPIAGGDGFLNAAEKAAGIEISGTAIGEAGSTVIVTWAGLEKTAVVQSDETWTVFYASEEVPADGNGSAPVIVRIEDSAGNQSPPVPYYMTIDTAVPDAPVIDVVATDDIVNASEIAGLQISGTAAGEFGGTVTVTWGGSVKTALVQPGGSWVVYYAYGDVPTDGSVVRAYVTDSAGNASPVAERPVTVDTSVPDVPVIDFVADDNVVNAAEKDGGVEISGTADGEAGSLITVLWGSVQKTATVQSDGAWSVGFASAEVPEDGSSNVIAFVTDLGGNVGPQAELVVTVDMDVPAPPIEAWLADESDTGELDGRYTMDAAPVLRIWLNTNSRYGAVEGDTLHVETQGGVLVDQMTLDEAAIGAGYVDFGLGILNDGEHAYRAKIVDAAGNVSEWLENIVVTVDGTMPGEPIFDPMPNPSNMVDEEGGVIVTGQADGEAGSTITVYWTTGVGDGTEVTGIVQPDGTWSVTLYPENLPPDFTNNGTALQFKAFVTDLAGNVGIEAASDPITTYIGGPGNDVLNAESSFSSYNLLVGGAGDDIFTGSVNDDDIHGGAGDDDIDGGAGDDIIIGGAGADTMTGGPGADTFSFRQGDSSNFIYTAGVYTFATAPDVITDFALNDTLELLDASGLATLTSGALSGGAVGDQQYAIVRGSWDQGTLEFTEDWEGDDVLVVYDGDGDTDTTIQSGIVLEGAASTIGLAEYSNKLVLGTNGGDNLNKGEQPGNFWLMGGTGNDSLTASYGDDIINGGAGSDSLQGGQGTDKFYGGTGVDDISDGWGGTDEFYFYQGDTPAFSSVGLYGTVTITADAGDTFSFEGVGQDTIRDLGHSDYNYSDTIWLLDDAGGYLTHQSFEFDNDYDLVNHSLALNDQSYLVVGGTWNGGNVSWSAMDGVVWSGTESFTVGSAGSDTLIIYDADASAGGVQAAAIVITGISYTSFMQDDGYLTYSP